jgi:2-C-methyl-D-erythritol 4-phosphate cytidylyltransferase
MHGRIGVVPPPTAAALVLAGGSGTRVGASRNKVLLPLAGRPVIARSIDAVAAVPGVGPVVLVRRPEDAAEVVAVLARYVARAGVEVVDGAATRQGSELAGLRALAARIAAGAVDVVLVHDGARPLASAALVARVLAAARARGGAVPGLPREDLAGAAGGDRLAGPAPGGLVAVQTPQAFRAVPLLEAYERAACEGFTGTDTASCVARFTDLPIVWVPGEQRNFKITYAHDLVLAERVLRGAAPTAAHLDDRRGKPPGGAPSDRPR